MKQTASEFSGAVLYISKKNNKTYEKEFRKDKLILRDLVLYLKCKDDVEVKKQDVYLKDIATLECLDKSVCKRCREIPIHHFEKKDDRAVISVLKVIQLICKECPGILVQSVGETDILIEKVQVNTNKGWKQWIKIGVVCLVSFFGTSLTIIAYNNDAGIVDIFDDIYFTVLKVRPGKVNILEITYSIGLAAGIILFFNHIGGRRITKDPTPIEVSMRNYERDVNQALIETADREGKEEDA